MTRFLGKLFFAVLTAFGGTAAVGLDCSDVEYVDERNDYGGALVTHLGCLPITTEDIIRFRASNIPMVETIYSDLYYAEPQPKFKTSDEYYKTLDASVKSKEFIALLRANDWVDALDKEFFAGLSVEYFDFSDDVEQSLGRSILAAGSLLDADEAAATAWHLSEFDSILELKNSQTIPYFADFLSYAYLDGIGVQSNFNEFKSLSKFASKTLVEAQRYQGLNLLNTDFPSGIALLKEAVNSGYISAIEDYVSELAKRTDTYPQGVDEILRLMPTLETLGFAGSKVMQAVLGSLYSEGVVVQFDSDRALSWYTKASEQGHLMSSEYLAKHYAEVGEYTKAAKYASLAADSGWVWEQGYADLFHFVSISKAQWPSPIKLLEYIKFHCLKNPYITSNGMEFCKNYPVQEKQFDEFKSLLSVIKDPSNIKYVDELNLSTGQYHALFIGNQNYTNWTQLRTPLSDIKSISNVLEKKYDFQTSLIEDASRRDILQAIYKLGERVEFNDHVLIYYAGHGLVDNNTDEGYWIPADADQTFRPDWVSNSEIKTALKSINSRHLLLIADSCYSGTITRSGAAVLDKISSSLIERLFAKKAKIAITSGGDEPVVDSVSNSDLSVFANALLSALEGNTAKFLPASRVFTQIREKVTKETSQTPQYANIRELDDDGGEFVFKRMR